MTTPTRAWTDIAPADATEINLTKDLTITAPLNEMGERCPWPWEPQQLVDAPIGQYHCRYCGAMVMAGMPHIDYAPEVRVFRRDTGWAMGGEPADCTTNFHRQQDGRPPCTDTAVWKVVELYDLHATFSFWCDNDLPTEHRPPATPAA